METNFLNVDAQNLHESLILYLENAVGEPLFPGDERRIFADALASVLIQLFAGMNDACKQRLLSYARGQTLDQLGESRGVTRLLAQRAETTIQFSIDEPQEDPIIIPAGIQVTSDYSHFFTTTESCIIEAGQASTQVHTLADEGGVDYNCISTGKINQVVNTSVLPATVTSVLNTVETYGGEDEEKDDPYRDRIRSAESRLSTAGPSKAYRYHAISANSRISDAVIISESETLKKTLPVYEGRAFLGGDTLKLETLEVQSVDDELLTASDYTATYQDNLLTITLSDECNLDEIKVTIQATQAGVVKIVPICAGGELPDEEILKDVYEACNADNVRPLTDKVIVSAPDVEEYDIEFTYWTTRADEARVVKNVEGEGGAIDQYVSWQSSVLGADLNPDQLKRCILTPESDDHTGATRVTITKPVFKELSPITLAKWSGKKTVNHIIRG